MTRPDTTGTRITERWGCRERTPAAPGTCGATSPTGWRCGDEPGHDGDHRHGNFVTWANADGTSTMDNA